MANGFNAVMKRSAPCKPTGEAAKLGSRRIFAPQFKLQVLDSYRADADCKGNQRATARKYGIHRRQIQKWLQAEAALRGACRGRVPPSPPPPAPGCGATSPASPGPVDLSLPRAPPPAAWDLSCKPPPCEDCEEREQCAKPGYEREAPAPRAPTPKPFKLFRPYLPEEPRAAPPAEPPLEPCAAYYEGCCAAEAAYPFGPLYWGGRLAQLSPQAGAEAEGPRARQCYSVDFKLRAVRSYYQDGQCRGNQRAVASKFRVHRRQVQKWLQQEGQLRLRTAPDLRASS